MHINWLAGVITQKQCQSWLSNCQIDMIRVPDYFLQKQEQYTSMPFITLRISLFVQLFQQTQYVQLIMHHVSSTCCCNLSSTGSHLAWILPFMIRLTNGVMGESYHTVDCMHWWIIFGKPWHVFPWYTSFGYLDDRERIMYEQFGIWHS